MHLCIHLPVIHEASRIRIVQFEGFFFFISLPPSPLSLSPSLHLSIPFFFLSLPLFFLSLSIALYNHARRAFAMRHISPKNPSYASCASTALGIYTKFLRPATWTATSRARLLHHPSKPDPWPVPWSCPLLRIVPNGGLLRLS